MAGKPVEFHPEALLELRAAIEWYVERSPRTAARFAEAVETGAGAIAAGPQMWARLTGELRRYVLPRFPYSLIFREREQVRSDSLGGAWEDARSSLGSKREQGQKKPSGSLLKLLTLVAKSGLAAASWRFASVVA